MILRDAWEAEQSDGWRGLALPATTAPGACTPGDRWQRLPIFLHMRAVRP